MSLFHIAPDSFVITSVKGTYYQRQVYVWGERVFIRVGAGYQSLRRKGTSNPNEMIEDLALAFQHDYDKLGRMIKLEGEMI